MLIRNLAQKYSALEAYLYDFLVADHALNLHTYIIKQAHLEEVLAKRKPLDLLDVGCGGGQLDFHLKDEYPYLHITGIDLSTGQINRACQRAKSKGVDITFETANAQNLPFPDAHFDVVYSFGSAKHWPDPLKGFGECWRVLKPGGELLVADATSNGTKQQVKNFYEISQFPEILKKPLVYVFYQRMIRPALSIETYRQIAEKLKMPPGTVYQLPSIPAFIFRTQKP